MPYQFTRRSAGLCLALALLTGTEVNRSALADQPTPIGDAVSEASPSDAPIRPAPLPTDPSSPTFSNGYAGGSLAPIPAQVPGQTQYGCLPQCQCGRCQAAVDDPYCRILPQDGFLRVRG